MTTREQLVQLRKLHEELSSINLDLAPENHVGEETIELLGQLVTDISQLVDQAKAELAHEQFQTGQRDLYDRVLEFDNDHPRVSQFLSQMTDLLAMMGI